MKRFLGFEKGMGIGGWLTNYKRFNVLPHDIQTPDGYPSFDKLKAHKLKR